jgi:malonyl-CoA O-methyltransferase
LLSFELNQFDRHAVRRAFERAAGTYDQHAVLQHEVGQRLLERLEYQRSAPAKVLDLGCGTGRAIAGLRQQFPEAQIIALDWSRPMLGRVRDGSGPAAPLCADMQALPLAARSVDLVFSNLAAQWSPDPARLFGELRRVLRPGGLLMFTTFGPDTLRELRAAWEAVDEQTHVNRFIDLHDLGDLLLSLGFAEPVMDMELLTLEYPSVLSLMRELKAIGAQNASADRHGGLTGKQRLRQMISAYERFRSGDRYPATFEVVYGAAFGPQEGQPVRTPGGETAEFSVEALRAKRRKPPG